MRAPQLESTFAKLDAVIRDLRIRNRDDGLLVPKWVAYEFLRRFHGEDWDGNVSALLYGRIDATTFEARQRELVRLYGKHLFQLRMDRRLRGETFPCPSEDIFHWEDPAMLSPILYESLPREPDPEIEGKWLSLFLSWGCSEAHARRALRLPEVKG